MSLAVGHLTLGRLVEALGMQHMHVSKVVIVADVHDVVRVYVERLATEENLDAVADAMSRSAPSISSARGLTVDEKGRAFVPAGEHAKALALLRRCVRQKHVTDRGEAFDDALLAEAEALVGEG